MTCVCVLPPVGQQVRPDQERAGDVEHQSAGLHAPGSHHRGGHPLPFPVHPHHPHRHEAAEAPLGLGTGSVLPPSDNPPLCFALALWRVGQCRLFDRFG